MKKLKVNKDLRISCGACVGAFPEIFEFGEDDRAQAKLEEVPSDKLEEVMDAIEGCPTDAISYEEN